MLPILAGERPSMVFVERARHLRRHPGQIGLPGGAEDLGDRGDPVRTALRELHEEIGVERERIRVVGRLPDVEQTLSGFRIAPIVGVLDAGTSFSLDDEEIAGIFTVPLAAVVEADAFYEDVEVTAARGKKMYALDYRGRHTSGVLPRGSCARSPTLGKSRARAFARPLRRR